MLKVKRNSVLVLLIISVVIFFSACNDDYTPRPKDYPYLDLPDEHNYKTFQSESCPFEFDYSTLAKVERDSQIFEDKPSGDCWLNIIYPDYDATIYLSYKELDEEYSLLKLKNEAHKLTYKHSKKANFIEPNLIQTENNVYGLVYNVGGAAASPTQFFITDTTSHWMRGALYFRTAPNPDSLRPLTKYVNQDIAHLIQSMRWK